MNEPKLFHVEPLRMSKNPMVMLHGLKEGYKCKDCVFLTYHETTKRYYKCKCRGITNGAGTDHAGAWEACKLFEGIRH